MHCNCGEITGEACWWSGPARETRWVAFVPRADRGTAEAAGTWRGLGQTVRVARSCVAMLTHVYDRESETLTRALDPWVIPIPRPRRVRR